MANRRSLHSFILTPPSSDARTYVRITAHRHRTARALFPSQISDCITHLELAQFRRGEKSECFARTPSKPTKPTRRGKHGGLREIERKILKENMN
jgi:hypothetical protein